MAFKRSNIYDTVLIHSLSISNLLIQIQFQSIFVMMRGGFNLTAPLGSGIPFSAINCSGLNYSLTLALITEV